MYGADAMNLKMDVLDSVTNFDDLAVYTCWGWLSNRPADKKKIAAKRLALMSHLALQDGHEGGEPPSGQGPVVALADTEDSAMLVSLDAELNSGEPPLPGPEEDPPPLGSET